MAIKIMQMIYSITDCHLPFEVKFAKIHTDLPKWAFIDPIPTIVQLNVSDEFETRQEWFSFDVTI